MYGIVNQAIEDLIKHHYGTEKWEAVKDNSGVDVDFFISNEPYDDDITYKLTASAAKELNLSVGEVLHAFGEWWVLKTGAEKYGGLMEAGGSSFKEFIVNLPLFHNRIMLIYPKLSPPEFKVSDITENSICLHYFSKRQGLQEFVRGLLFGIAKMYATNATIELVNSRMDGDSHEVFKISW